MSYEKVGITKPMVPSSSLQLPYIPLTGLRKKKREYIGRQRRRTIESQKRYKEKTQGKLAGLAIEAQDSLVGTPPKMMAMGKDPPQVSTSLLGTSLLF